MSFLMKFALGPVQDFIASARKLEDLWTGSKILSELVEVTLNTLVKTYQAQIIYPYPDPDQQKNQEANLPNIVLFRIDDPKIQPEIVASEIKVRLQEKFYTLVKEQIDAVCKPEHANVFTKQIQDQTDAFLDFCWVARRLFASNESREDITWINAQFDAAKRTRHFKQQKQESVKCTLQNNLSALHPYENPRDTEVKKFWQNELGTYLVDKCLKAIRTGKGERFSSIGLAKRLYRPKAQNDEGEALSPFPSTYSIATAAWRTDLFYKMEKDDVLKNLARRFYSAVEGQEGKKELDIRRAHTESIPRLHSLVKNAGDIWWLVSWEPQCLLETELTNSGVTQKDPLKYARNTLIDKAKKSGLGAPPKHYALLLADGDSMGVIVDSLNPLQLKPMSHTLRAFAIDAAAQVESHCGRVIYMGGDDLMAVLPVEGALKVACAWRAKYRDMMKIYDTKEQKATLSVAVTIAPVDYPLNRLLSRAHRYLASQAKQGDKDALALNVFKGNSLAGSVVLPTKCGENGFSWSLDCWARRGRELLQARGLSSKSIYDLNNDLEKLYYMEGTHTPEESWDIASRIASARLCTSRSISPEATKSLVEWMEQFSHAMALDASIRHDRYRFLKPPLLGHTLITLHKMWRMWGMS